MQWVLEFESLSHIVNDVMHLSILISFHNVWPWYASWTAGIFNQDILPYCLELWASAFISYHLAHSWLCILFVCFLRHFSHIFVKRGVYLTLAYFFAETCALKCHVLKTVTVHLYLPTNQELRTNHLWYILAVNNFGWVKMHLPILEYINPTTNF